MQRTRSPLYAFSVVLCFCESGGFVSFFLFFNFCPDGDSYMFRRCLAFRGRRGSSVMLCERVDVECLTYVRFRGFVWLRWGQVDDGFLNLSKFFLMRSSGINIIFIIGMMSSIIKMVRYHFFRNWKFNGFKKCYDFIIRLAEPGRRSPARKITWLEKLIK